MSDATTSDAVETGCGTVLREAREKQGLSLADAARQVKMRINTLEALEGEQWEQIGAPVFIRGQLRSYGRLLKVDVEPFLYQFEPQQQPITPDPLAISAPDTVGMPMALDGVMRRVVYIAITLLIIAVPVYLATQQRSAGKPQRTASLDVVPPVAPVAASLVPALPKADAGSDLSLDFDADSWVQISAPDGKVLEQGVVPAGAHRGYKSGEVGKLVLGNASDVQVQQKGNKVDTTPFQRANVARFTVSSDGSLAASKD